MLSAGMMWLGICQIAAVELAQATAVAIVQGCAELQVINAKNEVLLLTAGMMWLWDLSSCLGWQKDGPTGLWLQDVQVTAKLPRKNENKMKRKQSKSSARKQSLIA